MDNFIIFEWMWLASAQIKMNYIQKTASKARAVRLLGKNISIRGIY